MSKLRNEQSADKYALRLPKVWYGQFNANVEAQWPAAIGRSFGATGWAMKAKNENVPECRRTERINTTERTLVIARQLEDAAGFCFGHVQISG